VQKINVPYPYGIYFAMQRYTLEEYQNILSDFPDLNEELKECEPEEKDSLLYYYEDNILAEVWVKIAKDGLELSSPDIFRNDIYRNWNINRIIRKGFFEVDPRLTDDLILKELKGFTGNSDITYFNSSHSDFRAKIEEIWNNSIKCLKNNSIWRSHLNHIYSTLDISSEYTITIMIYCPERILESLFYNYKHSFENFLPIYSLQIEYKDKIEVYTGRIKWDNTLPSLSSIIFEFFYGDPFYIFFDYSESNMKIMKFMGLDYASDLEIFEHGERTYYKDIEINNNVPVFSPDKQCCYIEDFLNENEDFLMDLASLYDKHLISI
jgi:hypothetical protein